MENQTGKEKISKRDIIPKRIIQTISEKRLCSCIVLGFGRSNQRFSWKYVSSL